MGNPTSLPPLYFPAATRCHNRLTKKCTAYGDEKIKEPQTTWLNDVNFSKIEYSQRKRRRKKKGLQSNERVGLCKVGTSPAQNSNLEFWILNLKSRCRVIETGHLRAAFVARKFLIFLIHCPRTALGVTLRGCLASWLRLRLRLRVLWFLLIFVFASRPQIVAAPKWPLEATSVECSSQSGNHIPGPGWAANCRCPLPDARCRMPDPTVCVYDQQAQWDDELAARNVSKCCGRLRPSSSSSSVDSLGWVGVGVGVKVGVVSVANEILKRDTWWGPSTAAAATESQSKVLTDTLIFS